MRKKAKSEDRAEVAPSPNRNSESNAPLDLDLSYDDFVRAHGLPPLIDIKTACRVANVGLTRFYELVADGVFVLVPNGHRRHVTAKNLHRYYQALIAAVRDRAA